MGIKKKAAVRFMLVYLILTAGFIMFIDSYANSRSLMQAERTIPAQVRTEDGRLHISILGHSAETDISAFSPDSRLYFIMYVLSPDGFRGASAAYSAVRRYALVL